jgi:hypothetical protein
MPLDDLLTRLEDTSIATAVREGSFQFPAIECIHVLALTVVVGTIARMDLRLLGWLQRSRPMSQVVAEVIPITWTAFLVAAVTGVLLFSSNALSYAHNPYFRAKLLFLAVLGLNAALFSIGTGRRLVDWDTALRPPNAARVAGLVSLVLWIAVTLCGRFVGFTRVAVPH